MAGRFSDGHVSLVVFTRDAVLSADSQQVLDSWRKMNKYVYTYTYVLSIITSSAVQKAIISHRAVHHVAPPKNPLNRPSSRGSRGMRPLFAVASIANRSPTPGQTSLEPERRPGQRGNHRICLGQGHRSASRLDLRGSLRSRRTSLQRSFCNGLSQLNYAFA